MRALSSLLILALVCTFGCTSELPTADIPDDTVETGLSKKDNGAVVFKHKDLAEIGDDWCAAYDWDGEVVVQYDRKALIGVATHGGTELFSCRMDGVPNTTGRLIEYNFENTGGVCWTFLGSTENWFERLTPSGVAILKCHINPSG